MDGHKLPFYRLSVTEALAELRSNEHGLGTSEAADRLQHVGPNELERVRRTPSWIMFAHQLKNLTIVILIMGAGIAMYLQNIKTAVIMVAIALINTAIGFFQEHNAESLLDNLEQLTITHTRVVRHGRLLTVDSRELVPGDIIYLEAGDIVPADARVITEDELATNDFALTGESQPTRKFKHAINSAIPISTRHNMIYMGTTIATGNAHALVTGTGMHTELGRIADLSQRAHTDPSPLQREMNNVAVRITQGTFALAVILTVVQLQVDIGIKTALLFGVSIATAMIPNGLVAEVNITLAQAAVRLAHRRTLVKRLSAVETLGATDIIATDKTGTLTKNEMTAIRALIGRTEYDVSGTGYALNGSIYDRLGKALSGKALKDLHLFFQTGALASNAEVNPPNEKHADWSVVGDPTEGALITLARKAGIDPIELSQRLPERKEYAFDSGRKCMTSVREVDGKLYAFVKGAPESILECATELWDHGHTRRLTAADRKFFMQYHETHAADAERTLALAYRVLPNGFDPQKQPLEDAEQKLTLLGLVSMVDPLRDDIPAAMTTAQKAHLRVSVITGDYPATAKAVAQKAGLNAGDITVVLGEELTNLSDSQLLDLLHRGGAVFARISPEQKLRIVEIAKAVKYVVAVTGDSINDAPALKRADIGVAMGRTGTDVAKQAAEIVLLDDSFATLITAIEQGRLAFQNIKKAVRCALTDNMSELITVLISLAAMAVWAIPSALTSIQILAIDIAAQMLPIAALGWDPAQRRLMRDPPRSLDDHILTRKTALEFLGFGLLTAVLSYANYLFYFARHHVSPLHLGTGQGPYLQASILTFVTLICCQSINLLLVRSQGQSILSSYLWSNKKLLWAFGLSAFFIINIVYNPLLQPFVGSGALTLWDWCTVLITGGLYTLARLFHVHTKAHSRATLIKKHGAARVHAHLQRRIGKLGV